MNYSARLDPALSAARAGNPEQALDRLESKLKPDDGLLFYLEKGQLQRMAGHYDASLKTWQEGDQLVRQWEDNIRSGASQAGNVASYLLNDSTRTYEGRDYEKTLLSAQMALDHLALNDWENARVQITKMVERERVIANYRAKEVATVDADAKKHGAKTSFQDINGYPVQTLDIPEVKALKNAYESAFAKYLSGFVYEALGEPSLAAPGYNQAIAMQPDRPALKEALGGLDARARAPYKSGAPVDTLVVVTSGQMPTIYSKEFGMLVPIPNEAPVLVTFSWPVVGDYVRANAAAQVSVDGKPYPLTLMTSADLMLRKAVANEMPGIMLRNAVRAATRLATQKAGNQIGGTAGLLLNMGSLGLSVLAEHADERSWRTLPAYYSIARIKLSPGQHHFTLDGQTRTLTIPSSKYALVNLGLFGNTYYTAP